MYLEDLEQAIKNFFVIVLRGAKWKDGHLLLEHWNDIDLFVGSKYIHFLEYLKDMWFIINRIGEHNFHAYLYSEVLWFLFLDIIDDLNIEINRLFNVSFSFHYIKLFLSDPLKYKEDLNYLRYLLNFKKHKINFLRQKIESIDDINKNLKNKLFKQNILKDDLKSFLSRKILLFFKYFKIRDIVYYYRTRFREKKSKILSGQSYIFLGSDGVGKSTILDKLQVDFWFKVYYLGSLNTYYKDLNINGTKRKIYQRVWKFIQLYFIYLKTLYNINKDIFFGHIVLVDRFDRYPLGLTHSQYKIFRYVRPFFFKPLKAHLIGLVWDAKVIHKRKNELSEKETKLQNKEVKYILSKHKWITIYNDNLFSTLNKILFYFYS